MYRVTYIVKHPPVMGSKYDGRDRDDTASWHIQNPSFGEKKICPFTENALRRAALNDPLSSGHIRIILSTIVYVTIIAVTFRSVNRLSTASETDPHPHPLALKMDAADSRIAAVYLYIIDADRFYEKIKAAHSILVYS